MYSAEAGLICACFLFVHFVINMSIARGWPGCFVMPSFQQPSVMVRLFLVHRSGSTSMLSAM